MKDDLHYTTAVAATEAAAAYLLGIRDLVCVFAKINNELHRNIGDN